MYFSREQRIQSTGVPHIPILRYYSPSSSSSFDSTSRHDMYGNGDPWGVPFDTTLSTRTANSSHREDDELTDLDRASFCVGSSRHLYESDDGRLLEGAFGTVSGRKRKGKDKNKYLNLGCAVVNRRIFFCVVGLLCVCGIFGGLWGFVVRRYSIGRRGLKPMRDDDYTTALRLALMFFNAQKSGEFPKNNNVPWRGSSCMKDGLSDPIHKDLVGGFYEGGSAIKFNFPTAFSMTMLSWSAIEYGKKYEAIGELDLVMDIIKWGTDYLLKTFNSSSDTIDSLVAQVGVGNVADKTPNDGYCWMRPEDIDYPRPVYQCYDCSDLAAEISASLAAAAIVFKKNATYSKTLVHGAEKLYRFAKNRRSIYSIGADAEAFYKSTGYWDEFIWGGSWLYYATGNRSYLSEIATDFDSAKTAGINWEDRDYGVLSWNNKLAGAQVLLTRLRLFLSPGYPYEETLRKFHNMTDISMCSYLPFFLSFNRTEGGLVLLNDGDPKLLHYVVNAAFLASLYSDYLEALNTPGWYCGPQFYSIDVLRDFAKTQIAYILGANPNNLSYVVGFGNHYPTHVHHRGASIPNQNIKYGCTEGWEWRDIKEPNTNIIVGAMVAGPDKHDRFRDVRTNPNQTEPTLAGNAGLAAALISLSGEGSSAFDMNKMFSFIPPVFSSPPPPAPWTP